MTDSIPNSAIYQRIRNKLKNKDFCEEFIKQKLIEESKQKHISNYKLISLEYDKYLELNNDFIKECKDNLENASYYEDLEDIKLLDDNEIVILITLQFIDDICDYCNLFINNKDIEEDDKEFFSNIWKGVIIRLSKLYEKEEYSYFFKLFNIATNNYIHFNGKYNSEKDFIYEEEIIDWL